MEEDIVSLLLEENTHFNTKWLVLGSYIRDKYLKTIGSSIAFYNENDIVQLNIKLHELDADFYQVLKYIMTNPHVNLMKELKELVAYD
jgi:hypothetical protein